MDMVVQRRDGPRRLRNHDDDDKNVSIECMCTAAVYLRRGVVDQVLSAPDPSERGL